MVDNLKMSIIYKEAALLFLINREPDKATFMFERYVNEEARRLNIARTVKA